MLVLGGHPELVLLALLEFGHLEGLGVLGHEAGHLLPAAVFTLLLYRVAAGRGRRGDMVRLLECTSLERNIFIIIDSRCVKCIVFRFIQV